MIRIINGVPIVEGSGNVYADVGFPDAEEMLEKADLASQLDDRLAELGMTHAQAAELFNMPVSWLTDLLRGKFRDISRDEITACLNKLNSMLAP